MIVDGSIVNGDISNSADIAGSKLSLVSTSSTAGVIVKGDGSSDGYLQLNCSQNSHGIKLKSPPHSAGQSYTLTFPSNIVNGQFLKTDANGNLSWAAVDLTALSAANLTSGTIPDARFPATLPAVNGANLTGINTDLVSDTSPQLGGALASNGHNILFADGDTAKFGTGNDLNIYHNGSSSVIQHTNTTSGNNLLIESDTKVIFRKITGSEKLAQFNVDGAVELYLSLIHISEPTRHA